MRASVRDAVPKPVKQAAKSVLRRMADLDDRLHGRPVPPWALRKQVSGDFRKVGREFAGYLVELGGLRAGDRMLDIGCRAGRLAIPLLEVLGPDGRYEGVDTWPEGIEWCRRAVTPRHPGFRFRLVPDELAALPCGDGELDVALFATINGLSPAGFAHALAESARVLRPGGTYFGTWYLWARGEHRTAPALATTEEEARVRLDALGLDVLAVHRGRWDGYEPALSHQDVVVARRR
ncbi:MAG: class I SAM-dependent methyltransferase [Acidimicrobiales bacterium]